MVDICANVAKQTFLCCRTDNQYPPYHNIPPPGMPPPGMPPASAPPGSVISAAPTTSAPATAPTGGTDLFDAAGRKVRRRRDGKEIASYKPNT